MCECRNPARFLACNLRVIFDHNDNLEKNVQFAAPARPRMLDTARREHYFPHLNHQ
jgi:hypothetical protein